MDAPQPSASPEEKPTAVGWVSRCFSFLIALLFLTGLAWGLGTCYHPDTSAILKEAEKSLLPHLIARCKPEPVEKLIFSASVILTPFCLLFSLWGFSTFFRRGPLARQQFLYQLSRLFLAVGSALTAVILYKALTLSNFFYIRTNMLYLHPFVYSFVLFPLLVLVLFFSTNRWVRLSGKALLYGATTLLFIAFFFTLLWDADAITRWTHHLNPLLYPLAQILQGKTLLIDCPSLYGLFPVFLAPLFHLVGLTAYSFSAVLSLLFLAVMFSAWYFLRKNTQNDFLLLIGFLALLFFGYMEPRILSKLISIRPDPFFQYAPLRMLFPYGLLALATFYSTTGYRKSLCVLTSLLMALGVLWNFDSGFVAFCAWNLFLIYIELFRAPTVKQAIRPILAHLLLSALLLALSIGGYSLLAYGRTGCFPDWIAYFHFYKIFSTFGFFQIPMPLDIHLWVVVAGVYLLALLLSLYGLLNKEHESLNRSLFLLAVLGAGLFSYYQGRSHDANLSPLLGIPVLIVTLLLDHVLNQVSGRNRAYYPFLPLCLLGLFVLASALPTIVLWGPKLLRVWTLPGIEATLRDSSGFHSCNISFIKKHTKPGDPVLIYSDRFVDGLYHAETETRSAVTLPSSTDYFLKTDLQTLETFFATNRTCKIFVLPGGHPTNIVSLLQTRYSCVDQEPQTGMTLVMPAPETKK